MKVIELTRGRVTVVDDIDFEYLAQWRWSCDKEGYAVRMTRINGKVHCIRMHREIIKPRKGITVDHANRDTLDNRRCNLREATSAQQNWNKRVQRNNKLGLKGVCWNKKSRKFIAYISRNGQNRYLGSFATAAEAKAVRDLSAITVHEQFARS